MQDKDQLLIDTNPSVCYASKIVQELVDTKHYSLTRIARRCRVSTSTIHKLYIGCTLMPRAVTYNRLLILYHRALYGLRSHE